MPTCASRRAVLSGLAALPVAAVGGRTGPALMPTSRRERAVATGASTGRRFGSAVRPDHLIGPAPLVDLIQRDCALLVPEFHGQWSAVEWRRGERWYGNYDAILAFAETHGMTVRGHSLLWEQMTPDWARAEMLAARDWRIVERHVGELLGRYRGHIAEWVVVNEMIDTEHGHHDLRRTSVQRAFGNDYVRLALETAHTVDPAARLLINDYALEHDNPVDAARRAAMLRLVERLKRADVPLHVVGLQGHLELAKGPVAQRELDAFLTELAGMDVEIAVTELDVLENDRSGTLAQRDARVAAAVGAFMDVAAGHTAVTSLVTWALSDRDSWLQDRTPATKLAAACEPVACAALNRGLPYDGRFVAKPMRAALAPFLARSA